MIFISEKGYTLVETLVASAILMGVLIPATLFLGKITISRTGQDLIVATQLAQEEMERTITFELYTNDNRTVQLDQKTWTLVREIDKKQGLVMIQVKVYRVSKIKAIVELKTLRVVGN